MTAEILLLAIVLLTAPAAPAVEALQASLVSHGVSAEVDQRGDVTVVSFEGGLVVVELVPAKAPPDLRAALQRSEAWTEGPAAVSTHAAHLRISAVEGSKSFDPRDFATHLLRTRIVAAVAESSPASAVYWASGGTLTSPQAFSRRARDASLASPPMTSWVGFDVFPLADGTARVISRGMDAFRLRDLHVLCSTEGVGPALDWAAAMATYTFVDGRKIRHESDSPMHSVPGAILAKNGASPIEGDDRTLYFFTLP